jgi:ribosomal protein S18 acetylase RimI-like enzyme
MSDGEVCELLQWDSAFLGFHVARLRRDVLDARTLAEADAWCAQHRVRCLYFAARGDDATTVELAGRGGFFLADVRLTLQRDLVSDPPQLRGCAAVRSAGEQDMPAIAAIARSAFVDSRFYFDWRFPRRLCAALYEKWVAGALHGPACVLVTDHGRQIGGFVTCHLRAEQHSGSIGLLGVAAHARGRGAGRTLSLRALEWLRQQGARTVSVVTQGRNLAAQRLYQRCGFVSRQMELYYHKWYETA